MRSIVHLLVVLLGVLASVAAKHNLREAKNAPTTEVAAPVKKFSRASWTEPLHTIPASDAFSKRHIQQTGKVMGISAYAKEHFEPLRKEVAAADISTEERTDKPKNAVIGYAPNGFFVNYFYGSAADCDAADVDWIANRVNFCAPMSDHYSSSYTLMVTSNKKTEDYNLVMTENFFSDTECGQIMGTNAKNYGIFGGCAFDPSESVYFSNDLVHKANDVAMNGAGILISTYRSKVGCARENEKELESLEFRHGGCRPAEDGKSMRYECYEGRPTEVDYPDDSCSGTPSYTAAPDDCTNHMLEKFVCVQPQP